MKIVKFRIKNYKSIIDSGDCYLTDTITILAGKNESGKTSILEALEDFDVDKNIRDEAKPIKNEQAVPQILITFEFSQDEVKEMFGDLELDKKANSGLTIEITKSYPNQYNISDESLVASGILDKSLTEKIKKRLEKLTKDIGDIHSKYPQLGSALPGIDIENIQNYRAQFEQFKNAVSANINHIDDEKEREKFSSLLEETLNTIDELQKQTSLKDRLLNYLKESWIPNFILFSSFEDVFPNKIPFAELENNEWIQDLSVISDLNVETIKSSSDRERHKHKKDINVKLNKEYSKFWTQDLSSLSIDWDSEHLYFWIEEDGYPYEPSLRSKGRQWHLAFYIKVSARAREDILNIILIDEPGLFLHAQAQKDILKKLEDAAKDTQLIFATHSPYLLEPDKLNRIRLIHRTNKTGTKIENKIHALADKETLTPILTAIGLELNAGIAHIDKAKNVIVEGPSDFYYLQAFKKLTKNNEINFVYGGGAGNMPIIGTILHGWGCKVVYLYDNDQGKKDGEKNLVKRWLVSKDLILSVLEDEGSIEDIFTPDDFKKFVLKDENIQYSCRNSEYVKDKKNKIDKVLLSKLFLESIEQDSKISLSETTLENISKIFEKLEAKFDN